MSVSVFFSNKNIQVIVGKSSGKSIYIDKLIEVPMPENAILNGVIIEGETESIIKKLKEIWTGNGLKGNVDLIINSPQFISNRTTMPLIPNVSKATDYLDKQNSDEFGRFDSPIKGWYLLRTNKKENTQDVVTEVAERTFIETYIKIFSEAGITLNSVHDGVSLATELLATCVHDQTAIYMIKDAQMLVTILYEKGKYYYNSTRRLFQDDGTQEFAAEIRSNISGVRQFANSQHLESAITDVYFAGMSSDDVGMLQGYLADTDPDITVHGTVAPSHIHFKKWNDRLTSFIYPVAGLVVPKTGFSVLKAIRKNDEAYARKVELIKKGIPVAILTGVLLIITLFLLAVRISTANRLSKLEQYNNKPEVIQGSMQYDALVTRSGRYGDRQGGVDLLREYIDSYPIPDSSINKQISEAARSEDVTIEFNSYNADSGVFATTASSSEVEKIHKFIARLLEMDIFEDVDYTGYTWNDGDGTWSIKVICTLSGQAEKEEE
ncbi:MAG: hypothetical protein K5871_10980 [Lachnospiraceae bacterium]|nr:hypothetical protein [Lachnospiraceae bacterium]